MPRGQPGSAVDNPPASPYTRPNLGRGLILPSRNQNGSGQDPGRLSRPDPLEQTRVVHLGMGTVAAQALCGRARGKTETRMGRPMQTHVLRTGKRPNANDPAADPQAAAAETQDLEVAAPRTVPSEARRLHARLYHDAEEAELGHAEGCQGAPDQWLRGHQLYPR